MPDTKTRIIRIATNLILEKGYNAFSYADIAKQLNIKNAAIHYHFPTKEDLGLAIMAERYMETKSLMLSMKENNTLVLEQLKAIFDKYLGRTNENKVCMIGTLGADVLTLPQSMQINLKKDFELLLNWIIEIIEIGKKQDIFKAEIKANVKAAMIVNNLIAGAIVSRISEQFKLEEILEQVLKDICI